MAGRNRYTHMRAEPCRAGQVDKIKQTWQAETGFFAHAGKALQGRREDAFLATKFGITFDGKALAIVGTPQHVRESVEGSLERLQVQYIDLYYQVLHFACPSWQL